MIEGKQYEKAMSAQDLQSTVLKKEIKSENNRKAMYWFEKYYFIIENNFEDLKDLEKDDKESFNHDQEITRFV